MSYNITVKDSRLAKDGPEYKALIINSISAINPNGAQLILSYAQAGLPIVVVGEAPNVSQSLDTSLSDPQNLVADTFAQILALNTTKQVANQSLAPAALQGLGVK